MTIASINGKGPVKLSAGISINPDVELSEVANDEFDAVLLPGGEGHKALADSKLVGEILKNHYDKGKLVCTICLAAHVLLAHGIAHGKQLTSYPYMTEFLKEKYDFKEESVVQDGNLITSRGPGTVYAYATKIIENLLGAEKAKSIAELYLVFGLY